MCGPRSPDYALDRRFGCARHVEMDGVRQRRKAEASGAGHASAGDSLQVASPKHFGFRVTKNSVCVTTAEMNNREKAEVLRAHVNLGRPINREFARLLRAAGTRDDAVQYVLREFSSPGCTKERRPPTRLPSATPRTFDFNVIVGVDVLFVSGVSATAEHPVINITCLGTLYSTFGLIDARKRNSALTWSCFNRLWLRVFGAPQCVMFDEGKEFTGSPFQDGLEMHGIQPVEINRKSPFELGTVERRGPSSRRPTTKHMNYDNLRTWRRLRPSSSRLRGPFRL